MPLPWVREQLELSLAGIQQVAELKVQDCTGEAHQWIVRGKRRANFELSIKLSWKMALGGGVEVAGTTTCVLFALPSGLLPFSVSPCLA